MNNTPQLLRTLGLSVTKQAADEIESLRQQLAECLEASRVVADYNIDLLRSLAESQAREKVLCDALHNVKSLLARNNRGFVAVDVALAMPSDSTALDEAIRKAKREALLEAADAADELAGWDTISPTWLRRIADEL